jgi:hypothetical protein
MTQAVAVRRDGDAFQARLFWRTAALMLAPGSAIARVGFETGPKGYDDIWVQYDPRLCPNDQEGHPLLREHIQAKWHVSPNSYGHTQLVDPEFINANARSLLQRALAAQRSHAPEGTGSRFRLVSNWLIDRQDPLRELVHQRSHTLRLDRLFVPGTERSAMGRIRRLWCDHLGVTEAELRVLARTLALSEVTDSLDALRDGLDTLFHFAGLRRIPANESAFIYDDVPFQWLGQGRLEFDEKTLWAACDREGLLAASAIPAPMVFGVKSFEHATDRLEDRCAAVLDLVPQFNDRQIRPDSDWATSLFPALKSFLLEAAKGNDRLRLVLDAHLTLSFAAGAVLNIKSGRVVELEQRGIGKAIWAADDKTSDPSWPQWQFDVKALAGDGEDLAVAVCLTHDAAPAVEAYVRSGLPKVGRLLIARSSSGSSVRSVACGRHAFDLAEALIARIKLEHGTTAQGATHLFVAGPGAFSFFLGQRQIAIGPLTLYEFDFDSNSHRSYLPSLSLPAIAAT